VTTHDPAPVHAPDQYARRDPIAAAAVSVTTVPGVNCSLQSSPQSIPGGDEVTRPLPSPARTTVSVYGVKLAVTNLPDVIVTTQAPLPEQSPPHDVKLDPAAGWGMRVTLVPSS
jgi:hypothetical protein